MYMNKKMQCVKLRSVMGFYLNIHLNLFPIYVLLLLFTLSHGRPSAKVLETRDEQSKSHRQQFRDKWYQLSNLHLANNVNSVSNEYNSVVYNAGSEPLSHLKNDQQVSDVDRSTSAVSSLNNLVETSATGSHRDAMGSGHPDSQYTSNVYGNLDEGGVEKGRVSGADSLSHLPTTTLPDLKAAATAAGEKSIARNAADKDDEAIYTTAYDVLPAGTEAEPQGINGSHWYVIPDPAYTTISVFNDHKHSYGNEASTYEKGIMSDHGAPHTRDLAALHAPEHEQAVDIFVEDDAENNELLPGSQQQLVTFRQNILRSLGHHEVALEVNYSPTNVTIDYNDDDTLAKFNITKEEYLEAYTEYMRNVKNRKLANRGLIGVKDRRKNAVTITKTYHDNGTDLFSIGSKVLKLLRFDIYTTPTVEGADVRIRRVVLTIPAMCQITGHFQDSSDLPDLRKLSELTMLENAMHRNETEGEEVKKFDLTQNVTAWSTRGSSSSPYIVLAICSRDGIPIEVPHRHHLSHHGSSLRIVTKEFMKPAAESQIKRRERRAAPTEPSTLRSFTHKRDSGRGRECANTRHGKTCCRRSLKIKFSDLGISDVILEPREFDAHVCEGRCNARRVAYASTHAMFQHILHQTKGKKFAPRPCCVPTALTELDVLHLDPNGNRNGGPKLIVTILKDVIVKECGCS